MCSCAHVPSPCKVIGGLGSSVVVWRGISSEGCTDLHHVASGIPQRDFRELFAGCECTLQPTMANQMDPFQTLFTFD